MILSVSQDQTTLYDQIHYSGSPESFAWVLPISGIATVGLSSDLIFDVLDTMTHTKVQPPPSTCPGPPPNCYFGNDGGAAYADASAGGVEILKQEVVGPYETVQLKATDPQALNNWLATHNYAVPSDVQPVIDAYVADGVDFLAMKLVPGATVQSMRPVRVTTEGASPALPLRMVAAGTGASVGLTLWIVGEGRYEPQNFSQFHIEDSELVWDFATQSSNYAELRQAKESAFGNAAWEIESSINIYTPTFTSYVDNGGTPYNYYGYDAASDYDPIAAPDAGDGGDASDAGGETAEQIRDADIATLFHGIASQNVRVTRIRADLGRAALGKDLSLRASSDQSTLPNFRLPGSAVNRPPCPSYTNCPSDPNRPSEWGAGCGVGPANDGRDLVGFIGCIAAFLAHGIVRRRRKR